MTDLFEWMSQDMGQSASESPVDTAASEKVRATPSSRQICPFCGHQRLAKDNTCTHCTMQDTPANRQATVARIGPWFVLQSRNPSAPGMKYETVMMLITRGQITPRSIMRGPTTMQLWKPAANVRGISREFGLCYSCGNSVERTGSTCPHCERSQEPPPNPDQLLETRSSAAVEEGSHTARLNAWQRKRTEVSGVAPMLGDSTAQPARSNSAAMVPGNGRIVSAVGLAAALQEGAVHAEPKHRRLRNFFMLLLFIGAVAAGVGYFRPDYRQKAMDWSQDRWVSVREKYDSLHLGQSAGPLPDVALKAPVFDPAREPAVINSTPPALTTIVAPALKPTVSTAVAELPPQSKPTNREEPKAVPVPAPDVANQSNANPYDQARDLWRSAIDAEARKDDAGAIKLYQQIKDIPGLPADSQPAGLQLRMEMAQKRLAETADAAK